MFYFTNPGENVIMVQNPQGWSSVFSGITNLEVIVLGIIQIIGI